MPARRNVAIVGRAPTGALAPFDDPAWEIWTLAWVGVPRADRLFDIHHPDYKNDPGLAHHFNTHQNPAYIERVDSTGLPVYCHPEAKFKNGKPFPLDEVLKSLPRCYLDCTISYMVALAIHEGVNRIDFYGCNFLTSEEFRLQLPSVTWLIGLAEGRGIEVNAAAGSTLLVSGYNAGRYGINRQERFWRKLYGR